jgi:hypothetical protein
LTRPIRKWKDVTVTTIYQNVRSEEEVRREVEAIKEVSREITKDGDSAFDFLVKSGFITREGKLTPHYVGK